MIKIIKIDSRRNYRLKKILDSEALGKLMIFEGEKLVSDILKNKFPVETLIIEKNYYQSMNESLLQDFISEIWVVDLGVLNKLSELKNPSPLMAIVKMRKNSKIKPDKSGSIILLDNIQDPANFGAIFRSAAAFSIDLIVISGESVKLNNRKFLRAAQNSVLKLKYLKIDNMEKFLKNIAKSKINVYTTSAYGNKISISPDEIKKPCLVIFGNEGHGISSKTLNLYQTVCIPQSKRIDSLNLAISSSIIMYEITRKSMK
jgi:TrmH family RNA methyltransferase